VIKRQAWEKNWLLQHHWTMAEIEQLENENNEVPVEYLTGRASFSGLVLKVNRQTLIPRLETEKLVDLVVNYIEEKITKNKEVKIAEIGTGSGAIAITLGKKLAKLKQKFQILATDISKSALKVAKENISNHQLTEKIELSWANLLEQLEFPAEILIANLPYIPTTRKPLLAKSVIYFEPETALFAGKTGFDLIEKLLNQLIKKAQREKNWQLPEAIFLEIDDSHQEKNFQSWPEYHWKILTDFNQKNRYAVGWRKT
jgi:release factor glutamine methyltransferase